ncbi:alkaline phosphatase D family protein [Nonomuraea sp. NPDC050310]|uniref:alkaline phosphatase D family protein n=1 Tax=Nonomuraea sp. NPDC050310 TaxID=3154935 RepID=UPI0033F67223
MASLVVGPLLRYVDSSSASIWVETSVPCEVGVRASGVDASSRTFTVHGHHYAIVDIEAAGAYEVRLDGERVWPLPGESPSRITLTNQDKATRLAFGSCRTSVPHDAAHNRTHGPDLLRAYARHLKNAPEQEWPDALLLLGDQVYADSPSAEMVRFIQERRPGTEPAKEIADYEEYAELYRLAWSDPEIRWLLSTVPTSMIFDDHDLRDDWNTSRDWRRKMAKVEWWPRRVIAGLGAYWVYQHLGNLSPAERAEDELFARLRECDEVEATKALDVFAARADADPASNRWSYSREFGDTRLIMVDTRCARQLTPRDRMMLDPTEWSWLLEQVSAPTGRLVIGSSIPYLLPEGVHYVQNWNEALSDGRWGRLVARLSETFRQAFDLEHWAAFRQSFDQLGSLLHRQGKPVLILSGDVHYSYAAQAGPIHQLVCSPIRNPLSRTLRLANVITQFGLATLVGRFLARLAGLPRPPFRWRITKGPWFSNALATLDLGEAATVTWYTASPDFAPIDALRVK